MKIIFARHDQQGKKPNISEKNKKKKKEKRNQPKKTLGKKRENIAAD